MEALVWSIVPVVMSMTQWGVCEGMMGLEGPERDVYVQESIYGFRFIQVVVCGVQGYGTSVK